MKMDMRTRKTLVKEAAKRYRRAGKKDKGRLLDEFVDLNSYSRCYAAGVLSGAEKRRCQPAVLNWRSPGGRVPYRPVLIWTTLAGGKPLKAVADTQL